MREEPEYKTDPLLEGVLKLAENEVERVLSKFAKTIPGLQFNLRLQAVYVEPEQLEEIE